MVCVNVWEIYRWGGGVSAVPCSECVMHTIYYDLEAGAVVQR